MITTTQTLKENLRWHITNVRSGKVIYKATKPSFTSKYWNSSRFIVWDDLNKEYVF